MIRKLFHKNAVAAENASPIFRPDAAYRRSLPWRSAAAIVPRLQPTCRSPARRMPSRWSGCSRWRGSSSRLAAMDIGTAFGTMGARREMFVGFLAEPAPADGAVHRVAAFRLYVVAVTIVETLAHRELAIYPSLAFAGVAFTMVSLAENARIPIDNPATHLELTMIHEAMTLEYSARHLALIEWASALKLFNYSCIGLALFLPFWNRAQGSADWLAILGATPVLIAKLAAGGFALALIETLSAKMRIFRAPEFLGTGVSARGTGDAGQPAVGELASK